MILLSDNNRILEEIVTAQLNWAQEYYFLILPKLD